MIQINENSQIVNITVSGENENIIIDLVENVNLVNIEIADIGVQGLKGDTGEKGDKGDIGLTGIQGLQGEKGEQGLQGIQGIQGLKGDKGDVGGSTLSAGNYICMWQNTPAFAGVWTGTVGAGAGNFNYQLPTTTNVYTSMKRARYANAATTPNQVLGQRNTEAMFFRGGGINLGGFNFNAKFGFDTWTNGSRFFGGMHTATTVISANPSVLANTIGFAVDDIDNGLISFICRDTSTLTKVSTGLTIVNNKGYDIYMYAEPNASSVSWGIKDLNTGTEITGVATTSLPVNTTMLTTGVLASNGGLTPAISTNLGVNKIYVETKY